MTLKKWFTHRWLHITRRSLSVIVIYAGFLAGSFVLTGCDKSVPDVVPGKIPVMSESEVVQRAYERCVRETQDELFKDNPDTSDEIFAIMYSGVLQTCKSAVVITCDQGLETDACKIILDIYRS